MADYCLCSCSLFDNSDDTVANASLGPCSETNIHMTHIPRTPEHTAHTPSDTGTVTIERVGAVSRTKHLG